jgi:hypothetical protein
MTWKTGVLTARESAFDVVVDPDSGIWTRLDLGVAAPKPGEASALGEESMAISRQRGRGGSRCFGIIVSLLLVLLLWAGALSQGQEGRAADTHQRSIEKLYVAVQQGRLSVDLREADIGEILARIGQQAGIAILDAPSVGKRIGAQFTDVELDKGLRHLLRLASLSYGIRYAPGLTGGVAVTEVHVFGQGKDEGPPRPVMAEQSREAHEAPDRQSAMDTLRHARATITQAQPADPGTRANEFSRLISEAFGAKGGSRADPESPSAPQIHQPEPGDETQEGPEEVSR